MLSILTLANVHGFFFLQQQFFLVPSIFSLFIRKMIPITVTVNITSSLDQKECKYIDDLIADRHKEFVCLECYD